MDSILLPIARRSARFLPPLASSILLAALLTGACGSSSSTSLVAPTAQKCQISVSNFTGSFGASGGTGSATIDAARECSWSAASQASWIAVSSPAGGTGAGKLTFSVAANQAARTRSGALTVNGQQLTISQEAAACRFAVTPSSQNVPATGGTGSLTVSAVEGCSWTASSQVPWIQLQAGGGSGSGSVAFTVAANFGPQRSGTLVVAGQTVTVSQAATAPPPCQVDVTPLSLSFAAAGGQAAVRVTTTAGCSWNATTADPWITVEPVQGTRSDSVTVTASPNTSTSPRATTISIAGQAVQVAQDAAAPTTTVQLSGRISNRHGGCPSISFVVQGVSVVTTADTQFVNGPCSALRNDTRVVVDGLQQAGQPVVATRVTFAGN